MGIMPYEAFPDDENLQKMAAQYASWIKNKNFELLSAENIQNWVGYGEDYHLLGQKAEKELKLWLKKNIIESEEDVRMAQMIEWSLKHPKEQVWWSRKLLKGKSFEEEKNNRDLIKIGDLLQFSQRKTNYKLNFKKMEEISSEIYELLSKSSQGVLNKKSALDISELNRYKDESGNSLLKLRMNQVFEYLWKKFPHADKSYQKKILTTLYLIDGLSPENAKQRCESSFKAIENGDFRILSRQRIPFFNPWKYPWYNKG